MRDIRKDGSWRHDIVLVLAIALLLLIPAIANGFPLIFPDSGTYLGIAFGREYAVDRSSFYGLLLKPFVQLGGAPGLWLAVAVQAFAVAAALVLAARGIAPDTPPARLALCLAAVALLTALPWHAGQFMPDAFTGALVLIAWLAASRDPRAPRAPLLWFAAAVAALTHYTHLGLLATAAASAIVAQALLGLGWRDVLRRVVAALLAVMLATGALVTANGVALGRWGLSPFGSAFLFARLHEDGLIDPWLDGHCGRDAPAELCAARDTLPKDSQLLLWGGTKSPLTTILWHPRDDPQRWRWTAMLAQANRGAVAEQPLGFLAGAARGTAEQLVRFAAIDDECPKGCGDLNGGIGYTLLRYRPDLVAALHGSAQRRDSTPKTFVRAVTTPVTAAALLALPLLMLIAWRRRDPPAFGLAVAVAAALLANAAMAGALSDVHDRYQSRLAWLAPFVLIVLWVRWRSAQPRVR